MKKSDIIIGRQYVVRDYIERAGSKWRKFPIARVVTITAKRPDGKWSYTYDTKVAVLQPSPGEGEIPAFLNRHYKWVNEKVRGHCTSHRVLFPA